MKHQQGFAHVVLLVVLAVVIGVGVFVGLKVTQQNSKSVSTTGTSSATSEDAPAPLKNIGFNLGAYDPASQSMGDMKFTPELKAVLTRDPIYQKLIWADFGIQDSRSPNDPTKRNVQPTFYLPLGTKVLAPIDGVVTKVEKLYSGDTTIWFARDQEDSWSYELEHVDKATVKVGDKVTAGQAVAEVSAYTARNHPGYGLVELGLFHPLGRKPTHWCPFARFDPSVKDDYNKKITQLYSAWEDYVGDSTIYNQEAYPTPGCATLEHANG